MMRRIAVMAGDLAGHVLPSSRSHWHAAMIAEVASIEDDRDAAGFAFGCLVAGLRERLADIDTRFSAGIGVLALVGMTAAAVHFTLGWRGASMSATGRAHFFKLLQAADPGQPISRAAFDTAMPIIAGCFLMLALAHLCGAWLLLRGRLREFACAWAVGLFFAVIAVAVQLAVVWSLDGLPSEFIASLVQIIGLPALLHLSRARRDAQGSKTG